MNMDQIIADVELETTRQLWVDPILSAVIAVVVLLAVASACGYVWLAVRFLRDAWRDRAWPPL